MFIPYPYSEESGLMSEEYDEIGCYYCWYYYYWKIFGSSREDEDPH